MIRTRLKIDDGAIVDTLSEYGFAYYKSDNIVALPEKTRASTSYANKAGENIHNVTMLDAFDYTVEFFVGATNGIADANLAIQAFNKLLYTQMGDLRVYKRMEFYNDYKGHKIVGIPTIVSEPTDFWRDALGKQSAMIVVQLKIRVDKPELCDLSLDAPEQNSNVKTSDGFYLRSSDGLLLNVKEE